MTNFTESFSSYIGTCIPDGGKFGPWTVGYAGYGCVSVKPGLLNLIPKVAVVPSETHGCVALGPVTSGDLSLQVTVHTVKQIRTGSTPNDWEVGWVLWNYTDDDHFYSLLLKPTGWELGKEDPAYPGSQRFLAVGNTPKFPIGVDYKVKIVQTGSLITAYVNNVIISQFMDSERPYKSGQIGLYCEDSSVNFSNVILNS